jgi:hypothetical protein
MQKNNRSIMILGDSVSDLDGVGSTGYGPGRSSQSVWTRRLKIAIDPDIYAKSPNPYAAYRSFDVFRGGKGLSGQELASSGQNTDQGLATFNSALKREANPAIVVIAFTGTNDYRKYRTDPSKTIANIRAMVEKAWAAGSKILLIRFPPPNKTGIFAPIEVERYKYVNAVNAFYAKIFAEYEKKDPKRIAFVSDYYAPIRKNGVVPSDLVTDGIHVNYNEQVEQKLFDNIMKQMKPLMDQAGVERFSTSNLVDASHWWRKTPWFVSQVVTKSGGKGTWTSYWTEGGWKKELNGLSQRDRDTLELYSERIGQTYYAYQAAKTVSAKQAMYNRLSELLEYWWLGLLPGSFPRKDGVKAPLMFEFTRVSRGGRTLDPQSAAYGPLEREAIKNAVHSSHWWRTTSWFTNQIFQANGRYGVWLYLWASQNWRGKITVDNNIAYAEAEGYASAVRKALADHRTAKSDAGKKDAYARLAQLLEIWWLGRIEAVTPQTVLKQDNVRFLADKLVQGNKTLMTRPNYTPPKQKTLLESEGAPNIGKVLGFDLNADGYIRADELEMSKNGQSVYDMLLQQDQNKDGVLDSRDASWTRFGVWIDENRNGGVDPEEVVTLDQIGISAIDLTPEHLRKSLLGTEVRGLSDAELAKRQSLLVQTLAQRKQSGSGLTQLAPQQTTSPAPAIAAMRT